MMSFMILYVGGAIIPIITSLIGIVLGAVARKKQESKGIATAGLVLSIISLSLSVLFTISCFGSVVLFGFGF